MRPRLLALPALLSVLAGPVAAQTVEGRNEDVWTWSERVARGDWFHFASQMGDITVTEGSGDRVEVRAEKQLRRGRASDIGFIVVRGRDGVTICAVYEETQCDQDGIHSNSNSGWRNGRDRAGLRVTVRVPRGVKMYASSGNGDVSVSGATDEVSATSGNGKVRVSGSGGSVKATSGNGEVTVEGARGPVEAHSGNGDVNVATSLGPVSATSGNGDIIVTMDALGDRENMQFTTGNGRIRLSLPSNFAGELEASTGNGDVVSDFPITLTGRLSKSHIRGTIGRGGPRLKLVSGNGQIELRAVR
jgi:putative adhesin